MVEAHGQRFGVEPICRALGYRSASVVYARRSRSPSPLSVRDEEILAEIGRVRKGYAAVYGARRTWKELRRRGVEVARRSHASNAWPTSTGSEQVGVQGGLLVGFGVLHGGVGCGR